ncbi:RNase H [Popillia japonica]|uniref:RNase H n=1 Tax=Popillia japonica TaxID=7064 RepID=A0AAW1KSQ5_POPJA
MCIFTDGAKNKVGTACAFFIPSKGYSKQYPLPNEASVFTAEAFAIKQALQYIQICNSKRFTILSDSKSVLISLLHLNGHSSPIIVEIAQLNYDLKKHNKTVNYIWIKGHSDISLRHLLQ